MTPPPPLDQRIRDYANEIWQEADHKINMYLSDLAHARPEQKVRDLMGGGPTHLMPEMATIDILDHYKNRPPFPTPYTFADHMARFNLDELEASMEESYYKHVYIRRVQQIQEALGLMASIDREYASGSLR